MTYFYKGTNINTIIQSGTTTGPSSYSGFPSFLSSNYNTERPLDFGYYDANIPLQNQYGMVASYQDFNYTGIQETLTIPSGIDAIRVIAIGAGGGRGGTGGAGYGGVPIQYHPGGNGANGEPGQYVAYTGNALEFGSGATIYISVGGAGAWGNNGNNANNIGSGGNGNDGSSGGFSAVYITSNNNPAVGSMYICANGGGGGGGGGGGNANNSNPPNNSNVASNNNYPNNTNPSIITDLVSTYNNGYTIPTNYNPINYLTNVGQYQHNGAVRIYFLKN